MKITLIGATGFVGSALLQELLQRGHQVTALTRDPSRFTPHERLQLKTVDVRQAADVAATLAGQDAVISAFNPGWTHPDLYNAFLQGSAAIVEAARQAGVRLLVVGGAGSLFVAPGVQLVDTPEFPAQWKQGALAARDLLTQLQAEPTLDWTFLSPPVFLEPGPRSGSYRLGRDEVLMGAEGPARISVADLAMALVDETETPRHRRQRFTVAA
jgi:putative NADH-flavin reductase